MEVENTTASVTPEMHVDRTIKSEFAATWLVEVEKDFGLRLWRHCSAKGRVPTTDAALPSPSTPRLVDPIQTSVICRLDATASKRHGGSMFHSCREDRVLSNVSSRSQPNRSSFGASPGPFWVITFPVGKVGSVIGGAEP